MKFLCPARTASVLLITTLSISSAFAKDMSADGVAGVIDQSVTIPVPGKTPSVIPGICGMTQQYNQTVQQALSCLQGDVITQNAIVTIKLIQDQTNADSIVINHAEGKQINIVGDCTSNPNNVCTITFKPGIDGVEVASGNSLGGLSNLTLIGTPPAMPLPKSANLEASTTFNGIDVRDNSLVYASHNMTVENFYIGLNVIGNSTLYAQNISSLNNSGAGMSVARESTADINDAKINNNGQYGVFVSSNSYVRGDHAEINDTATSPFNVSLNSIFFADDGDDATSNNATANQGCTLGGKIINVNQHSQFCATS